VSDADNRKVEGLQTDDSDFVPFLEVLTAGDRYRSISVPWPASFKLIGSSDANNLADAPILYSPGPRPPSDDKAALVASGFGGGVLRRPGRYWFKTLSTVNSPQLVFLPLGDQSGEPAQDDFEGFGGTPRAAMLQFHGTGGNDAILIPANPRRKGFIIDIPNNLAFVSAGGTQNAVAAALVGLGYAPTLTADDAGGATYPTAFAASKGGIFLNPGTFGASGKPTPTLDWRDRPWKGSIGILALKGGGTALIVTDFVTMLFVEFV
jgi:hypothetical protein